MSAPELLGLPSEILVKIVRGLFDASQSHDRHLVFRLICKEFDKLYFSASKAQALEVAHSLYPLAAAVRPWTGEDEEAGLMTTWIPCLRNTTARVLELTCGRQNPCPEATVAALGLHINDMLGTFHFPWTPQWRTTLETVPLWCVKAIRLAAIRISDNLIQRPGSRLAMVLEGVDHQKGLEHLARAAVQQHLLKEGLRGDFATGLLQRTPDWTNETWNLSDEHLPESLRELCVVIKISDDWKNVNKKGMRLKHMLEERLDLMIADGFEKAGIVSEYNDKQTLLVSLSQELGEIDEPGLAAKLSTARDSLSA